MFSFEMFSQDSQLIVMCKMLANAHLYDTLVFYVNTFLWNYVYYIVDGRTLILQQALHRN